MAYVLDVISAGDGVRAMGPISDKKYHTQRILTHCISHEPVTDGL
jgi:hypothetical protein